MKKLPPPPVFDAWHVSQTATWGDASFDLRKAAVCVVFSELVYYHAPGLELGDQNRMWMVPCLAHQQITRGMVKVDFRLLMQQLELPEESFSIFETENIVGLLVRTRGIIVVALRGTQKFYDVQLDFMIGQEPWPDSYTPQKFHAGFLREAKRCLHLVQERLARWGDPPYPIYLTGHSLGGAIAAVIATMAPRRGMLINKPLFTSTYTFGMPRYANKEMMAVDRPKPYPILRPRDAVPWLPPKEFGYEECLEEFSTSGTKYSRGKTDNPFSRLFWKNHKIERYRRDIHAAFLPTP